MADLDNIANLRSCIKSETHWWAPAAPVWVERDDLSQDVILAAIEAGRTGKKFGPLRVRTIILMKLRELRHQSFRMREVKCDLDEKHDDFNVNGTLTEDFFGNHVATPEEICADKEERELLTRALSTLPAKNVNELKNWVSGPGCVQSQRIQESVETMRRHIWKET